MARETVQPATPGWGARVRAALPRGRTLPEDSFERRHRWMLWLLWSHAVLLPLLGVVEGYPLLHNLGHLAPIVLAGTLASRRWAERRARAVLVSIGLLTCSALLVHIEHGLIEMHFHFFVMISVLTLYEDWVPFLVALGYVLFHHGVLGMLDPAGVYDHAGNPWAFAALHGAFVAAAGAANVVAWRLNEDVRAAAQDGYERTRLTLDTANEAFVGMDAAGVIVGWNAAAEELFGWPREEALGMRLSEAIVPHELREAHDRGLARFLLTEEPQFLGGQRQELPAMHRDGHEFPVEMSISGIKTTEGWRFTAFMHDISERKAAERLLHDRTAQQAAVAEFGRRALGGATAPDVMEDAAVVLREVLDVDFGTVLEHAPDRDELVMRCFSGDDPHGNAPQSVPAGAGSLSGATLRERGPVVVDDWSTETRFAAPQAVASLGLASGISVVIEGRTRPFGVLMGHTRTRRSFSPEDVSFAQSVGHTLATAIQRLEVEAQSRHDALHDSLTGLPNRALFLDRLAHALARGRRRQTHVGVFFIDLDQFKVINDSLGHAAGDRLLQLLAPRLAAAVRAEDTVARFGGDEFVVLCEDIDSSERAAELGERILGALSAPFDIDGDEVFATVSVGVAIAQTGSDPDSLLRDADAAMYRAKERGRERVELFDAALRTRVVDRLRLESALRRAMEREELHVAYQPIVALGDARVIGAEALLRWEHPGLEIVSPAEFIPVAEETGLIVPIGRWVLEQACREAASWPVPIGISVNVSPRQLSQGDFVATVTEVLHSTGLPPSRLTLEITENVFMERGDRSLGTLEELKATGIGIALDDFGSGYSSLGYLRRLPIDTVKLDRSFIGDLARLDASSTAIASAVVAMAHALGLGVVAEGVETAAQAEALRRLGCGMAQGYHFGRPGPVAGLRQVLDQPGSRAA